jgi:hypothetical protein
VFARTACSVAIVVVGAFFGRVAATHAADSQSNRFEWRAAEYRGGAYVPARLLNLLVTGKALLGANVSVSGVLSLDFEDTRLYLTKEDYEFYNTANSIHLTLTKEQVGASAHLQGTYVEVSGRVVEDGSEPFPNSVGITDVKRLILQGPLKPRS